jgi:hypothetical protein
MLTYCLRYVEMTRQYGTLLTAVRRPEYTGANRCLPCTAVNLLLATGVAAAAAFVSRPLGAAVATASLAAIYFRGYLVPGTPELTKRYLPERVLAWFGKADAPATPGETAFDTVGFLDRYGVVVDIGDDVALAPAFERGLDDAALGLDTDAAMTAAAADLLAVDPDRVSFASGGGSWRVLVDGSILGRWESRAAFVADLAAHRTLSTWTDEWASVPGAARGRTLSAVRACLDSCPTCGGTIRLGTETVSSCCREYEVVAATCADCDARLFETDAVAVAAAE